MRGKGVVLLKVLAVATAACIAAGCTAELRKLQGANQQLVMERDALNSKIAELNAQLDESNQARGDLEAQLKKTQAEITNLQGQVDAYAAAVEEYKKLGAGGAAEGVLRDLVREIEGAIYIEGGGIRLPGDVLFDSGKTTLKTEAVASLQKAAAAFQREETRELHLRVDGHTDNQPIKLSAWKDNMELSQARARAVWLELRKNGVAPERMFTAGFGEFVPITDNASDAGRASNRRVEIWLVPTPVAVEVTK